MPSSAGQAYPRRPQPRGRRPHRRVDGAQRTDERSVDVDEDEPWHPAGRRAGADRLDPARRHPGIAHPGIAHAGIAACTRSGSSPSHSGLAAVPS